MSTLAVIEQGRGVRSIIALLAHVVVTLVIAGVYAILQARTYFGPELLTPLSWILLVLSGWLLLSWWLAEGSLFNPYGLFLIGSMPFHVGYAVLRVLDQESMVWLRSGVTDEQMTATVAFVLAGYAMLHLGALVAVASSSRGRPALVPADNTRVYQIGWLLLAIAFIPMLLKIRASLVIVMSGGYSSLFEGGGRDPSDTMSGLIGLISEFYLPGVMFMLAGSRHRRLGQVVSLVALVLYCGSYLFMGFRAFSLIPVAVYIWLWHRCVRRLPIFPVAVTGAASFLLIAPLIRRVRDMSGVDRLSFDILWEAYMGADNPLLTLLAELSGSILTISFTTELVPEVRPFEWGFGYARSLMNAVPMLHLPDPYGYAGSWLAWHVTPHLAVGGFGLGFSFMAEAYLNFGYIGGAITIAFIGLLIAWAQKWGDRADDPARLAFLASFLPILIFFTRGETLSITRPILWYALIPLLAVYVLRSFDRKLTSTRLRLRPDRMAPPVPPRTPVRHSASGRRTHA